MFIVKVVTLCLSLLALVSGASDVFRRPNSHRSLEHVHKLGLADNCTLGNAPFRQSCYGFGQIRVTWDVAIDFCKMFGGYLAEISDDEENRFIADELTLHGFPKAWIGGSDIYDEGIWQWRASSMILHFDNWGLGQPDNNNGGENCLAIHRGAGRWSDNDCNAPNYFVCETRLHAAITQATF